jgi:hypothetical protein
LGLELNHIQCNLGWKSWLMSYVTQLASKFTIKTNPHTSKHVHK